MKQKISTLLLLIICSLFHSCSVIIGHMKSEEEQIPILKINENNYCSEANWKQTTLLGRNKNAVKLFHKLLNKQTTLKKLSFIEQSVLWTLFQMNLRPDLTSPTARLQIAFSHKGTIRFYDFSNNKYPFIEGLNFLLKTYPSKRRLSLLAGLLDRYLPKSIPIEEDFANFLVEKASSLKSEKIFKKIFFKADEPLQKGESLPKISYSLLLRKLRVRPSKNIQPEQHLFKHKEADSQFSCNQDFNLYKKHLYPLQYARIDSNSFGISSKNGDFFFASTSQDLKKFKPLKKSFLLTGVPRPLPFALCFSNNHQYGQRIAFVSNRGKDPGQLLYELIKKLNGASLDLEEMENLIKNPRKLHLMAPNRMLFESELAKPGDLQAMIKNNQTPIYHARNLGEIWAFGKFGRNERFGFVKDSRNPSYLSCR